MAKSKSNAKTDNYQLITDQIVEMFEKVDSGEWAQPWTTNAGFPRNGASRNNYNGVNVLTLWAAALSEDYSTHEWFTFNQAKKAGGCVKKGQKGRKICFFKFIKKEDDAGKEKTFPVLRVWTVFNRDQIDGLEPLNDPKEMLDDAQRIERAEAFISATGATFHEGHEHAAYTPSTDKIRMPDFARFKSPEDFYTTALHELGHWTGHESRLERDLSGRFGNAAYAAEELIAELCSAFLAADLGLQCDLKEPAKYLKSWIKLLKNDKYAIFTASRKAQDAAEFLTDLQPREKEGEQDAA